MDWEAAFAGLTRKHYGVILADPPWLFKARTALQMDNPGSRRDVERHYSTMTIERLCEMPVRDLAAKDCHLFMWTTAPCLQQSFDVMKAWGFRYSSMAFTWVKLKRAHKADQLRLVPTAEADLHVGLGLTTRKNAEFCLLGRRGSPRRNAKDVREIIMAPVREHSRKPDAAIERIERYCDGPRLELFARTERPGWTAWGNQTDHFPAEGD